MGVSPSTTDGTRASESPGVTPEANEPAGPDGQRDPGDRVQIETVFDELHRTRLRLRDTAIAVTEQQWTLRENELVIDRLTRQLAEADGHARHAARLRKQLAKLQAEFDDTTERLDESRKREEVQLNQLQAVRTAFTWRVGAPVRALGRKLFPDSPLAKAFRKAGPQNASRKPTTRNGERRLDTVEAAPARSEVRSTAIGPDRPQVSSETERLLASSWPASGTPLDAFKGVRGENQKRELPTMGSIRFVDMADLGDFHLSDPDGIVIIMPAINRHRAFVTANVLLARAYRKATVVIALDTVRNGFIKTLNTVYGRVDARYVVYLAEDAFPGKGWLKSAHRLMERRSKGLLAFNDGKWDGRIAAFGMVRTRWARDIYRDDLLYSKYKSHRADNEITVIARALDQFVYGEDCVLIEMDIRKIFRRSETDASNFTVEDKILFKRRFSEGFDGLVPADRLAPIKNEYIGPRTSP